MNILALFVTSIALVTLATIGVHAGVTGRPTRTRLALVAGVAWAALYGVILLAVSLTSREAVLGANQPKHFCGFYLDCHMMVSIVGVERAKTLGSGPNEVTADGSFYVATVKVSSDAVGASLSLGAPTATVLDAQGTRYRRSLEGERALEAIEGQQPPLNLKVEASTGYTTRLVFDLPEDALDPRLHIAERHWMARLSEILLIGDEDSFLHKRIVFRL